MPAKIYPLLALGIVAASLQACEPTIAERGNLVDPDRLAQVKVGDDKEAVVKAIGSPTAIGTFEDNDWFYMGQRTEQESFFLPEVTARKIVEVDFDQNDKVANIRQYGKQDAETVHVDEDETPVQGHETTTAEMLFGRGGFGSSANKDKKQTNHNVP